MAVKEVPNRIGLSLKTKVLKSNLCDHADAYISVTGTINII